MRNSDVIQVRCCDPQAAPPGWCLRCIARCQARAGERYERARHAYHTVEYVEAGFGTVGIGGEQRRCGPGDAYLLPLGIDHCITADTQAPWRKLFIDCTGALLDQLRSAYGIDGRFIFPGAAIGRPLRELLTFAGDDAALQLRGGQALHEVVALLHASTTRSAPAWPAVVRLAKDFIDTNLERSIRLADVADHAGCSEAHLSRCFRRSIGCSPGNYLLTRRIELAKALLDTTAESVKTIAERLGYCDAFSFSHAFAKATGCAPTAWRNRPAGLPSRAPAFAYADD